MGRLITIGNKKSPKAVECPHCRVVYSCRKKEKLSLSAFHKNWALLHCLAAVKRAEDEDKAEVFDVSQFGYEVVEQRANALARSVSTPSSSAAGTSFSSSSLSSPSPEAEPAYWVCLRCTLHNRNTLSMCDACDTPRVKRRRLEKESAQNVAAIAASADTPDLPTPATVDSARFLERISSAYNAD